MATTTAALPSRSNYEDRREALLQLARKERSEFVEGGVQASPGDPADRKTASAAGVGAGGAAGADGEVGEGFAFPVTQKIISFLSKFNDAATGPVPEPDEALTMASAPPGKQAGGAEGGGKAASSSPSGGGLTYSSFIDKMKQADQVSALRPPPPLSRL